MTKTKVAPFYLGHGVVWLSCVECIVNYRYIIYSCNFLPPLLVLCHAAQNSCEIAEQRLCAETTSPWTNVW